VNVDVFPLPDKGITAIKNVYHTPDRERRTSWALSRIAPYTPEMIPDVDAGVYLLSGLMLGDIADSVIDHLYGKKKIAFDVQGVLRVVGDIERPNDAASGEMVYYDWPQKKRLFPMFDFLKTDARESKVMCGTDDREQCARMFYDLGAKEIMITRMDEVIVFDGKRFYRQPLVPRNLSGRSGRGDNCFGAYIVERQHKGIEESLLVAAAAVSLKMENPGPFTLGRQAVEDYIARFYRAGARPGEPA
jgi:sugar/nucleoside kinase (ribokinase family)